MNISSLFSNLPLSNTKDNVIISSLSGLRFWAWAGQRLVSCHQSPWCLHSRISPCFFSISLFDCHLLFSLCNSPQDRGHSSSDLCFVQHLLQFLTTGRSWVWRKRVITFTSLNTFLTNVKTPFQKGLWRTNSGFWGNKWTLAEFVWIFLLCFFFPPKL